MTKSQVSFDHIEAVFFDLDGTLVETDNRWARVLSEKLKRLKTILPHLDPDILARDLIMALEAPTNYAISICERLGMESTFFGLTDRIRRSKGLATREASVPVEGSRTLLESLHGRYKMAVVTTRARPEAKTFLNHIGAERFFSALITRQDVFRMKPHPEPLRKAAALLGVSPSRCLMVGDTAVDMRAARRAGAYAVGVLSGFAVRVQLERAGAHLILERAVQLLEHLPELR